MDTDKNYQGYYALIQYRPDAARMEALNVGLVLYSKSFNLLVASIDERSRTLADHLPGGNREGLLSAAKGIVNRLNNHFERFPTLDDLQKFVDTRANTVILSPFRSVRITDPSTRFQELYGKLVLRPRSEPEDKEVFKKSVGKELKTTLGNDLLINPKITIEGPYTHPSLDYGVLNGRLRLISVKDFSKIEKSAIKQVANLTLQADQLRKYPVLFDGVHRKAEQVVMAHIPKSDNGHRNSIVGLFKDYKIPLFEATNELVAYLKDGH